MMRVERQRWLRALGRVLGTVVATLGVTVGAALAWRRREIGGALLSGWDMERVWV